MRAEPSIPLFLWVAAALVVHAIGGGGASEVSRRWEETLGIRDFAEDVWQSARGKGASFEVSLYEAEQPAPTESPLPDPDSDPLPEEEEQPAESEEPPESRRDEVMVVDEKPRKEDQPKTPEKEEPLEKKAEEEKEPELAQEKPSVTPANQAPRPAPQQRVAVQQLVDDPHQEDNPDARFAAEEANRVDEETRATVTSTDGGLASPTLSASSDSAEKSPGNSHEQRVAQRDEAQGDEGPAGQQGAEAKSAGTRRAPTSRTPTSEQAATAGSLPGQQSAPGRAGQQPTQAQQERSAQVAMPETVASTQSAYAIAQARQEEKERRAQRARDAIAGITSKKKGAALGLGSQALTDRGVNLNLDHRTAQSIVGDAQIAKIRSKSGERRLSQHRGSWTSLGLTRWQPALENYTASVKAGNQTALNTARVPFARYLNEIHQRLHQVFAGRFLGHLSRLPGDHPLSNRRMSTHLEIALDRQEGKIVKMGVIKSSGVTGFDIGALDSVEKAGPFGPPPPSIVSFDGNVYLHWEFYRKPEYACSTYFAHPFLLDGGQESAPPQPPPPQPTKEKEKPSAPPSGRSGNRSGPLRGRLPG